MTVLVAYESGQAATEGIAQQIADRLQKAGLSAIARPVTQVDSLEPYRAVVLGSAVCDQGFRPAALAFLGRFAGALSQMQVWLFSSSAVGEIAPRVRVVPGRDALRFRDHRHFKGAFERRGPNLLGDLFLKVCGGAPRDRCDFRDVDDWTAEIARELQGIDRLKERRRLHLSVRGKP